MDYDRGKQHNGTEREPQSSVPTHVGEVPHYRTEEVFTVTKEHLTPAQAWEGFVGNQTVEEFLAISKVKGLETVEAAVVDYAQDLPTIQGRVFTKDELETIIELLIQHINENVRI